MQIGETILEAKGITKLFPGVTALQDVDFDLRAGEVHIIVGENGAGKSTLAKCIVGAYRPEAGEINLEGKVVHFRHAADALKEGIRAVYQEFTLIPYLNVAQNIFINREYRQKSGLLDVKRIESEAKDLLTAINCENINVKTITKKLKVAEQQMVEIAKALSFKPKIIVFDEPTATLTSHETCSLFEQIHKLKRAGIGIIYISHKVQEFAQIGDRITILRDGKKITTVRVGEKTIEEIVNLMVGRDINQVYHRSKNPHSGESLRVENLSDFQNKVKGVSLNLSKGEIVGLAGLVGAGRTELANLIFGIDKLKSGEIWIKGKQVAKGNSPTRMVKRRVGFVCEDRKRNGLALNDSVAWNIMEVSLKKHFPYGFFSFRKIYEIGEKFKASLRIVCPNLQVACKYLSGGNQQKVVLAKWLGADADILIFDEPTRGIDVGAKMEIYTLMDKLALEGKSILMISSELQEVIGMSDRIYVVSEGRIIKEFKRGNKDFNNEDIGASMLGLNTGACL